MNKEKYTENWADEIRPSILKRDNYKCKRCKVKHRSIGYYENNKTFVECDNFMIEHAKKLEFKLVKIILQVHHKNGNKKDNADSNLISLCVRCHLSEERDLNVMKRKLRGIIYPKK